MNLPSMPSFGGGLSGLGPLLGFAIKLTAQLVLVGVWLARIAWFYCVTVPLRARRELLALRAERDAHQCVTAAEIASATARVALDDSFAVPMPWEPAPEPVGNDDSEEAACWFCDHAKSAHEDDYACAMPACDCATEQYSRPPVWHAGGPIQYRDRVVNLDGTTTYERVMA